MTRVAFRAPDEEYQNPADQTDERSIMFLSTQKGLIQGLNNSDLEALKKNPTTRGQSVTIIERTLKVKAGEPLEGKQYVQMQKYFH
ncbi:hypothetical protein [Paenibacillus mucilaginosus]|uniref:Uncharacterized protein n=1 Tax=Paenibacillus mucilaginosus (strain KNP414) TaxID=1036673 RepID=F8FHV4_PAEMK|nr:hypothetical protein [Paenibacillus mucilaginosus]AEI42811.1 hypothetical protein KNP414_04279 [Paenibacillus mucilaginosus KNP414]MCG7216448.1 hypothetical protein [Paenibacillus mucilaginosus]WDM30989.1 hypothetical protein KCX80_18350 [Paenibacillus mucilaginosus]